jgi:hypothetical protein
MFTNPELKDNEIFLGNFSLQHKDQDFHNATAVPSRRYGRIAYDIYGEKMEGYLPVFISREDAKLHDELAIKYTNNRG